MIKLADLLREVEETPTSQEQDVIDDLLGSLDEGMFDTLLAKAKSYAKKGLLTAAVLAALMAAPQLSVAQKGELKDIAQTTMTTMKGTSVDGIVGQFTSQFKFPNAFLKDLDAGTTKDLGTQGNEAMSSIRGSKIGKVEMDQWNDFVSWMKEKGYSGKAEMDHVDFSGKVLNDYRKAHPDFWIKNANDIKTVQKLIKDYRTITIAQWMNNKAIINIGNVKADPSNPQDIDSVMTSYMRWAK